MGSVYRRDPIKKNRLQAENDDRSDHYASSRSPQQTKSPKLPPSPGWQMPNKSPLRRYEEDSQSEDYDEDSDISDLSDSMLVKSSDHNNTDERIYPHLDDFEHGAHYKAFIKTPEKRSPPEPTPQSPTSTKTNEKTQSSSFTPIIICLFIIFACLPVLFVLKGSKLTPSVKPQFKDNELVNHENVSSHVFLQLETLKRSVGVQQEFVWKRIRSAFKSVLAFNCKHPAVVTVIIPERSRITSHCIVHKLADMVRSVFSGDSHSDVTFSVASTSMRSSMASQLKQHAEQSLEDAHVWTVEGFEQLTFESVSLLMAYTDQDFAPYKRAVIFLELHVDDVGEVEGGRSLDVLVEGAIMEALRGKLKEDKILAIISRVSGRAVLFHTDNTQLQGCAP